MLSPQVVYDFMGYVFWCLSSFAVIFQLYPHTDLIGRGTQDSYKELTSKTVAMGRCLKVKTLTQHGYQAMNLCQWFKVNDRYDLATHAPVFVEFHLVPTCFFDLFNV